jgi:hypothetical protein
VCDSFHLFPKRQTYISCDERHRHWTHESPERWLLHISRIYAFRILAGQWPCARKPGFTLSFKDATNGDEAAF